MVSPITLGDFLQFGFAAVVTIYILTRMVDVLKGVIESQNKTTQAVAKLTTVLTEFTSETRAALAEIRRKRGSHYREDDP